MSLKPVVEEKTPPYTDSDTGNLVLQLKGEARTTFEEDPLYFAHSIDLLTEVEERPNESVTPDQLPELSNQLRKLLEEKGEAYRYTKEYFATIREHDKRQAAYQALEVSDAVPIGEEADIQADPYKFLGLPPDATLGQARATWIRLAQMYHPDRMDLKCKEQRDLIFGKAQTESGKPLNLQSIEEVVKNLESLLPPKVLPAKAVEAMDRTARKAYEQEHRTYQEKQTQFERIQAEMRRYLHEMLE